MRHISGPDFQGIREVMERIGHLRRKMGIETPPSSVDFDSALKEAEGNKAVESKDKESSNLRDDGLSGAGSIVRSMVASSGDSFKDTASAIARRYGVDERLVHSVISVESAWRPDAISPKGAVGLMQLMPGTAKMLGVDPDDPVQNIEGGVKYLSRLSEKYNGDLEKTLAAYNAGPGRVDSYGGIPPFRETENYVRKVLGLYRG
ncbi:MULTISPECIES: lytic transglycosylase domain-containing protein [Dethiosulfovibrio]|uniref:Lytic transglycosylase catalytic n=3 Tax=Dethiosulfovibrio TaxID=47054 RepID=D2Z3L7_9BACT|nr:MULTISPECIES: lytic transglycosylase domain-containing protein [Dethiosulfovibrio]EFC90323.1 Lytic transglycosylase catalytic [Dethiosulfovibrio peptidovorans DSM 11002]MCF4113992.1 lytic transglycosylase domain-containing protein [Dethiosulfovibrio russensis]MCF4141595.1 lytic transglycosylase domain-containing protein [Dethiosulfovibrio marinus]MCF4143988.1 lytic transglycosylase domain-containing protein [Dethiosulfovibrio acidaminovorans]